MYELNYISPSKKKSQLEINLCDEPYTCVDCTQFLHRTKRLIMTDWYVDTLQENEVYSIALGAYITGGDLGILKMDNLNRIMSSIKNCFNELEDKEFDGKKFLLHSRLRTDWIGESISVEYEVFFPPIECISSFEDFQQFVDKIEFETNYKKVNKIYELDDFEPEFQKINLYDIGEYEDIFRNLKIQIGNSTENNIEEIIYLHTLGTYMYHYNTNTGFSCEFIKTNEENILNPTKNEK